MRPLLRFLTEPRYARVRLIALTSAAGLCVLLAAWIGYRNYTSLEETALPLSSPLANANQVGVNAELEQYAGADLDVVLAQLRAAGFRWVRQVFPWDEIEPLPGEFAWETWDVIVSACATHDLELIAVLDRSPRWARANQGSANPHTPPQEVADWGDFVGRVARRYRGQIAVYQLWDEPNLSEHWGGRYVDAMGYLSLLREGAIRIRDADPGAALLLAALAPTVEQGPLNLNEVAYLRQLVKAGAGPYFDVVALQPYGFGDPPETRVDLGRLNFSRLAALHRAMVDMGLGDRPVWAAAWGWNALPPGWAGRPTLWASVGEDRQAEYVVAALRWARREWPWLGAMILYTYQPDLPLDDPRWGFAMVDAQGSPRPVYAELSAYLREPAPLRTGVYPASSDSAQYLGEWRFSSAGADPPRGAGGEGAELERNAVVAFDVVGTALDLQVRRGAFWGVLYVTVDGLPAAGLPRDEGGRSYIVLYDPAGQMESVPLARGLDGRTAHHVEVAARGGWGQWPLVGWTVWEEQSGATAASRGAFSLLFFAGMWAALGAVVQILSAPHTLRPLYAWLGRVFAWYRGLPEWIPVLATLSTALAFALISSTSLSLLLMALLYVLFFLRIDLGLAALAFALPAYLEPKTLFGRPFSVVELSLGLCAGAWLLARLLDWGRAVMRAGPHSFSWWVQRVGADLQSWPRRTWQRWTALDKGMAASMLVAALALGWSTYRQVAVREFRVVFVESALFYLLLRLAVRSPRAHRRLVEGWLLGATAISLVGIWQLLTGQNLITAEGMSRVRGLYGSPNNLALYLERALPVLLAVAWQGRGRQRAIYGLAAVPVLVGLVATLSKGALLLGLPAALLALGLLQRERKAVWMAVGAVAIVFLLLLPLVFTERFRSLFDLSRGTAFFRLKLWRSTLRMIADQPLTGVGLDNYLYFYRSRYVLPSAWGELNLSHPHNLLLDVWTRLGLAGVVVWTWVIVSFFRVAFRELKSAIGERRALLLGLVAAMVAVLAHGLVDQAIFLVDLAFVFCLLLALANPRTVASR